MLVSLHITYTSAGGMECLGDIVSKLDEALAVSLKEDRYADEYVVIRTCNRLEAYISTKNPDAVSNSLVATVKSTVPFADREFWYILKDKECIKHLFTVICGIDSLIVGEDQIQHQIKDAFSNAMKEGHVGRILYSLFNNAIIVGKKVRTETELNKGAVSVGYAAIELAERKIGTLEGKDIAIIGAGDMAGVIAKNLVGKGPETVIVSNRTFQRAQELARELKGTAIGFDRLQEIIARSDLILVATSAKHNILDKSNIRDAVMSRSDRPLLIIDVSVPTNVDPDVEELPGVTLRTMASLDSIAAENVARRKKEINRAEKIIQEELRKEAEEEKEADANEIIRSISVEYEAIRAAEVSKAVRCIGTSDTEEVLNDLTRSIVSKISADIIKNLRKAASKDEVEVIEAAKEIFSFQDKKE